MMASLITWAHIGVNTDDSVSCLDNGLWRYAVLFVVLELHGAATFGFVNGALHRVGDFIGIHNHFTIKVAGSAACRLGQGAMRTQETFLVGIENSHERNLRQVKALAQQVHAHEHINHAKSQVINDLNAVHRLYIAVHISALDVYFCQVVGQFLSHALSEGCYKHTLTILNAKFYFVDKVVDLAQRWANGDLWVEKACGAKNLLGDYALAAFQLVVGWCRAHVYGLVGQSLKLCECQWPVVVCSI